MTSTTFTPAALGHVARTAVRPAYLLAGTALTTLAVVLALTWQTGLSSVLVFAVLPDVAFLLAIGRTVQHGQLAPRAVPAYNLLHGPVVPLALLALAAVGALGQYWVVAAITWGAHIAIDRGCGYGLRTPEGWQRG